MVKFDVDIFGGGRITLGESGYKEEFFNKDGRVEDSWNQMFEFCLDSVVDETHRKFTSLGETGQPC